MYRFAVDLFRLVQPEKIVSLREQFENCPGVSARRGRHVRRLHAFRGEMDLGIP
jgi:hypothetical protein